MLDLNTEIKEALRKGKSKIHIKGQEYSINDAIKMNTYMNGGYKKYQNGNMYSTQNPFLQNPSVFGAENREYEQQTPNPLFTQQNEGEQSSSKDVTEGVQPAVGARQKQTAVSSSISSTGRIEPELTGEDIPNYATPLEGKNNEQSKEDEEDGEATDIKTFNPYAGVDIPSAAAFLGQSIESGNTGMGVAAGAKLGLGVARNILGGMGRERVAQDQRDFYREQQRDNMEGQPRYSASQENGGYFEMGGVMPAPMQAAYQGKEYEDGGLSEERVLTGEFMQGVSPNNEAVQPNSELEDGEHIHSQDGSSIKVEGKDHEQGGEEMELQEGDRVISNNLKLKGDGAKKLKQNFDVKVKAKDTYAKAVDKIYSSIGLSKIIKEEEEVLGKLKKIEEEVKDETTRNLNSEFLYKKLKDIQAKKEELEPIRQQALETVFNLQEASKPKEETEEQLMFEDGGLKVISERYNIPIERAKELLEEYKDGGYKKYQEGGTFQERLKKAVEEASYKGEDLTGESKALDKIPPGQSKKILDSLGIEVYGGVTPEKALQTISKNPWYDWNSFDGSKEAVETFQETYNSKVDKGSTVKVDGKFGEQTQSAYIPWLDKQPEEPKEEPEPEEEEGEKKHMLDIPMTPDQGVLPPSGMASQLNVQRRYDRVDPKLMSPDAMIEENNRQAKAAIDATADLPDSQRAAAIGQINSQLQQKNNQAISQVEMQNAQIQNQAESQNIQIQGREEDIRVQDALSYEQRQQTAQAKTEENVRNFYDYLRKNNNARFNETVTRNALNQYNENFSTDSLGNVIKTGEGPSNEDLEQKYTLSQVQSLLAQQQAQKKYGGKYKNKK